MNNGQTQNTCTDHEGVSIAYSGDQCPLCLQMRATQAIAVAASKCGMVLIKLHLLGVPFAIAMPRHSSEIGCAAQSEINAALAEMVRETAGGEAPAIKVSRPSLLIPR